MAEVAAELLPRNFHNDFNEDDEVIGIIMFGVHSLWLMLCERGGGGNLNLEKS